MWDTDCVVIGAGAAGIGAGLTLQQLGANFVILEADNRLGGRAFTDTKSLPVPWDHGCHWLHSATQNPLVDWADRLGAEYLRPTWENHFTISRNGHFVTEDELVEARKVTLATFEAIEKTVRLGKDVSVASVLPDARGWDQALRCVLQTVFGDNPENISTVGYGDYENDGADWPVVSGFGDLIAKMAMGLPLKFSTPVKMIEQTVNGVRVETPNGNVKAKAVIVTVSTHVLRSELIRFSAGPARDLLDWITDVPLGQYEKVAFALRNLPPEAQGKIFCMVDADNTSRIAVDFQVMESNPPLMIAHIAGDLVRNQGLANRISLSEFAKNRLIHAFGTDFQKNIMGIGVTNWRDNPFIGGSYSHSKPGTAHRRREMLTIDTGNVLFAGEAFSPNWQSTAHGAFVTGQDAARRLATSQLF
ncbi:MAG: NAD(P)/FAD-dependent oxidoreductase [Alphaproteobacteria bacterium]|nr:NAD(P)/FAD-dependent oxidoreductase [Alphaproteobacteria bacterium]